MLKTASKWLGMLIVGLGILVTISGLSGGLNSRVVNAQDATLNVHALLQRLSKDNITMTVRFMIPPVESEPVWIIPSETNVNGEDVSLLRSIKEIGEDYICFGEVAGGSRTVDCVPFTNIASITYDEYP